MTRVGQCPVCHSTYELGEDDIGHVLECDCGAVLFACHTSENAPIEVVCGSCKAEYEADPGDAGEQLDCDCGQSVVVPSVVLRQPLSADSESAWVENAVDDSAKPIDVAVVCPDCGVEYEVTLDDVGQACQCQCGCEFMIVMDESGMISADNVASPELSSRPVVTTSDESKSQSHSSAELHRTRNGASWVSRIGIASVALLLIVSIVMFVFRDQIAGGDSSEQAIAESSDREIVALSAARDIPELSAIGSDDSPHEGTTTTDAADTLLASAVPAAPAPGVNQQSESSSDLVEGVYRVPLPPIYALPTPRQGRPAITIPFNESSGKPPTYEEVFQAYQETVTLKKAADKSKSAADVESYHQKLGSTIAEMHRFHEFAILQSDAESNVATINSVRYLLAYLYFTAGRLAEAAVMGEAVARWGEKEEPSTHEAAMIALAAMQEASETHWGLAERVGELAQMQRLTLLIASRWPVDPQLDLIWMNLGFLYEAFNYPQQAGAAYLKVKDGSEQYAAAQIAAGNALWAAARRKASEDGKPIDDETHAATREILSRGLAALEESVTAISIESISARLSLAQIELNSGHPRKAESWLTGTENSVVDSIYVSGRGRSDGIEVSEVTARHIFDALFAARRQAGDQQGAQDAAAKMARVLGWSPEELASKTLTLVTGALRRAQTQSTLDDDDVAGLIELSQPFLNEGSELTPANLMWIGEAWSQIGLIASDESVAQQCAAQAAAFYRVAITHDDFPPSSLQSARLRSVQLLRASGDPVAALEMTEQVLTETPNVFALQVEAAETLQQLGIESNESSQLVAAVDGKGGGSPVWGWGKLVTTLHPLRWSESGTEAHAELLIRSQYNLAKCRVMIAKTSSDKETMRPILSDVHRMLRTLLSTMDSGDHPWRDRLEQLSVEVEQLL